MHIICCMLLPAPVLPQHKTAKAMSFYQRMGFKPTPATVWNYPGMYEAA